MTLEPKKFDQIYQNMVRETQKRSPSITDFQVGSVIRTMYESFAYEIAVLYEQMNQVYLSGFIDSAESVHLDMLVAVLGINRGSPDFAEGMVTFTRDPGTEEEEIEVPLNTLVVTQETDETPKRAYLTIEAKRFAADQAELDVKVQSVERGEAQVVAAEAITIMPKPVPGVKSVINRAATQFLGKRAETDLELRQRAKNILISSGKASLTSIETALLSLPSVKEVKLIERFKEGKHGLLDVFVDGVDLTNDNKKQYLLNQIDRVRAAGIFVRLQSAVPITVDAVFRFEINPDAQLSEPDRQALEATVQKAIADFLAELKMGQPLLFAQLIRRVLSVPNVNNLEQFSIAAAAHDPDSAVEYRRYEPSDRQISAKESQKFNARHIRVTAQPIAIPVRVQMQVDGVDRSLHQTILTKLKAYFQTLKPGIPIKRSDVQASLQEIDPAIALVPDSLKLLAQSWSPLAQSTDDLVDISFAEQAELDENIFVYRQRLQIIGALKFTPPDNTTNREKERLKANIQQQLLAYVDYLNPEEDVDLKRMKQIAQEAAPDATIANLNPNDFQVLINGSRVNRLNQAAIDVQEFEKAELTHFCVTSSLETIQVTVTQLAIRLVVPRPAPTDFNREEAIAAIRPAVVKAIGSFPRPEPGQSFSYNALKQAILDPVRSPDLQALLRGVTCVVSQLTLRAVSNSDNREQIVTIETAQDLHVRSVEVIHSITPPDEAVIEVTV